jgi:integrase
MAMLAVLDRLGYAHVTVHGFRATFATWAEECTDHPDGVREAALADKYKDILSRPISGVPSSKNVVR